MTLLECVVNLSEGRDAGVLEMLAAATGDCLLDVHRDPDHHRSVFTVGGVSDQVEAAVRALAAAAVRHINLRVHRGVHPRIGALDVVPWVHLVPGDRQQLVDGPIDVAVAARDRFACWAGGQLDVPGFLYGPERTLPELRRQAWDPLRPATGPDRPHPSAGAVAVGARPVLVAYNLWLAQADLAEAQRIARALRGPHVRTLALAVGAAVQVSCNLISPWEIGPAAVFDAVASRAAVARAELVGLVPGAVVAAIPRHRRSELDVSPEATIEARLEEAGLDGGRFA